MQQMIDYLVVHAPNPDKLQERVRASMNKGWSVWGSVSVFPSETIVRGSILVQVMVKYAAES